MSDWESWRVKKSYDVATLCARMYQLRIDECYAAFVLAFYFGDTPMV